MKANPIAKSGLALAFILMFTLSIMGITEADVLKHTNHLVAAVGLKTISIIGTIISGVVFLLFLFKTLDKYL